MAPAAGGSEIPATRIASLPPFDPCLRLVTTGDRKAKWIWIASLSFTLLAFVALRLANPQFGSDGMYYLLSSISQVLAAVVALSVTLPLAFAGLSDYLPSFGGRIVASWHLKGFITLFTGTIAFALVMLCFKCAHELLLVAVMAAAAGCLAGLVPYLIWIAERTNPRRHFDCLLSSADTVVHRHAGASDLARLAGPASEVEEYLGLLAQTASVAAQRGTSIYLSDTLIGILIFWLKYDARGHGWAADRGRRAWGNFMLTNSDKYFAIGTAGDCASRLLVRQCWQGTMRPSAAVFGDIAESLTGESVSQDSGRIVAVRACWRIGVVAQHNEADGKAARSVAHHIAVTQSEITEDNLPLLFPMFENHVTEWFRMFADIDPTKELAGFRQLVIEEHAVFRHRLAEASR